MTTVPGNTGLFTLGSLNASTGWLPFAGIVDDVGVDITGTFVGTVTLQTSNQDDAIKTAISNIATYTAATLPIALPRIGARWFRLIMTAYTSGTATVGVSRPNSAGRDSIPVSLTPQPKLSGVGADYFINPGGDQA